MKEIEGLKKGMGIGGWLTNYKRFNVLPQEWRLEITKGDMEHFETYITESDIVNIKNMGFDHVRVGFDQIVLEEEPYVYRKRIFEILGNFVGWCESNGLKVVFNLHKAIGNYCDIEEDTTIFESDELKKRFIGLWLRIEEEFSGNPDVMFELLNEVRDVDPEDWNNLAAAAVEEIRKVNAERKIIIGSINWNDCDDLDTLRLYDDENIIYTFHTYKPFEFTHQRGVLQARTLYYNREMKYPSDDIERYREYFDFVLGEKDAYPGLERMDKEYIRQSLEGAVEFTKKHPDKILWCGEFGTIRHADITSRENWMEDVISILGEYDIPYCVWNYLSTPNDGNRFSLVDDDTREILSTRLKKVLLGEK